MTQDQLTQVLDKLRDDENYYGDFGKQFLSNSDIRSLLNDPLGFKKPIIGNPNLIQGAYFHTLVLEPGKLHRYKLIDVKSRNNNTYKELSEGEMCLLQHEADMLNFLSDRLMANITDRDLIRDVDVE